MASAISRTSCSLTSQPNLFQLFQPMGGVFASEANGAAPVTGTVWAGAARTLDSTRNTTIDTWRMRDLRDWGA
jgi:hypothetical protein